MDSSRRLGSISRKRTSAGVIRYRIEQSIALRPTDLPVPVAPATSRCGIAVRSDTTGPPVTSLPRASGSFFFGSTKSAEAKISRRYTMPASAFGTSMATGPRPGIGPTMRTGAALAEVERLLPREARRRPLARLDDDGRRWRLHDVVGDVARHRGRNLGERFAGGGGRPAGVGWLRPAPALEAHVHHARDGAVRHLRDEEDADRHAGDQHEPGTEFSERGLEPGRHAPAHGATGAGVSGLRPEVRRRLGQETGRAQHDD